MAADGRDRAGTADKRGKSFHSLPGAFRLKRQRLIRPLFDRSRNDVDSISRGLLRVVYRVVRRADLREDVPIQVGFAPGRLPTAVQRNRIKRVLREVYRVNQKDLVDLFSDRDRALTMMIVYRGHGSANDEPRIREDLPVLLGELHARLGETSMSPERRV